MAHFYVLCTALSWLYITMHELSMFCSSLRALGANFIPSFFIVCSIFTICSMFTLCSIFLRNYILIVTLSYTLYSTIYILRYHCYTFVIILYTCSGNSKGGGRTRRASPPPMGAPPPISPNDFTDPARPPPISPSFHKVLRICLNFT